VVRLTDANLAFAGSEPKFPSKEYPSPELTQGQIARILSWYSQNKETQESFKYAREFFKKKFKLDVSDVIKSKSPTFGFVCRMVSNGAILSETNQAWFDSNVNQIKRELSEKKNEPVVVTNTSNVINIQDRIREKADECIAELEGQIDELIVSNFSVTVSPVGLMHSMNIKSAQTKLISEAFKKRRAEFDGVLNSEDEQIKEGYSNFSKSDLKKLVTYCDQVILACLKISETGVQTRKPRKRKVKSPEEIVSKLNFSQNLEDTNIQSIDPTQILGASQLWVYNKKTRKLGLYVSEDASGFSVKNSSIVGFSEFKSVQKILRKPEETLNQVLQAGKVALRTLMDQIKAKESVLNGRLNGDIVLLRVLK
jgi:hypothetical protein